MISIVKKSTSKNLYVQFYLDGKCVQRSTKLEDTPTNRKFIKNSIIPPMTIKILNGEIDTKKQNKDFDFFAKKYLASKDSLKTYDQVSNIVSNQLLPIFSKRDVTSIKRYEINEFADSKITQKVTPKRVKILTNTIAAILDIAIEYEVITDNIAKGIKLPKHVKKDLEPFTQKEVNLILSNANSVWFRTFLAISFYTGIRTGEALALNWNDINLNDGFISITKGLRNGKIDTPKTKSSVREVPIFDELEKILKEYRSISKSIPLFLNPHTGNMFYKSAKLTQFWKELLTKCNIEYRILYSTRHTFITTMLKSAQFNMLEIAQMAGHSNTEMIVRNYAKFIKGEHLKINRSLNIFTDEFADSSSKESTI
jgi:integrase